MSRSLLPRAPARQVGVRNVVGIAEGRCASRLAPCTTLAAAPARSVRVERAGAIARVILNALADHLFAVALVSAGLSQRRRGKQDKCCDPPTHGETLAKSRRHGERPIANSTGVARSFAEVRLVSDGRFLLLWGGELGCRANGARRPQALAGKALAGRALSGQALAGEALAGKALRERFFRSA